MENRIAKGDPLGELTKNFSNGVMMYSRKDKDPLVAENVPVFLGYLSDGPALERVFQVDAVHHWGSRGGIGDLLDLFVNTSAATNPELETHPAQANGIYLTVELGHQIAGAFHIPIGTPAPHVNILAKESRGKLIVAIG